MRRLVVSSRAEIEITDAARWYEQQSAGLGADFLAEIDKALVRITTNPLLFPRVRKSPDVRRVLIERFPYHVWFYRDDEAVRVFAVLHARRDPQEGHGRASVK